jgi:hypothetical protein
MQRGIQPRKHRDCINAASSEASFAWKAKRGEARTLSRVKSPEATAIGRP